MSGLIQSKIKLVRAFMPVLVTSNFDDDSIKNEPASMETGLDQKQPRKGGNIVFPIVSQWGLSVAMETRVLIQSASKPYTAFPPPQ